jgi:hypothetical protein
MTKPQKYVTSNLYKPPRNLIPHSISVTFQEDWVFLKIQRLLQLGNSPFLRERRDVSGDVEHPEKLDPITVFPAYTFDFQSGVEGLQKFEKFREYIFTEENMQLLPYIRVHCQIGCVIQTEKKKLHV